MLEIGSYAYDKENGQNVMVLECIDLWGYISYKVFDAASGTVYKAGEDRLVADSDNSRCNENYLRFISTLYDRKIAEIANSRREDLISRIEEGGLEATEKTRVVLLARTHKEVNMCAAIMRKNKIPVSVGESIILSEFIRKKITASQDKKEQTWLTGCIRNLDSMMSAINLLVEAEIKPEQLDTTDDRNLKLLVDAWNYLQERDSSISDYKNRMESMASRAAWEEVFAKAFSESGLGNSDAVVFMGFYYITPIQEHLMRLLEEAGFQLIYLIPYDERFPFVYEIWDKTYTVENGYEDKANWNIEKTSAYDPYSLIFEGEESVTLNNKLEIKEYGSIMEFVDDVKRIKDDKFTLYASCQREANEMLKDYFPEEYGERKILAYPIGQFVSSLTHWVQLLYQVKSALDVEECMWFEN